MADFRRLLYAFAIVALLVGFTVPASAQSCTGTSNNPLIRGEEYTAMVGDIRIDCTGGTPTILGLNVPKIDITVFTTTTTITSKLTDSGAPPATTFNEALLIFDDAGSSNIGGPAGNKPMLNCGSPGAPYSTSIGASTPFSCDIVSADGTGAGTYNGTAGHPNVYQGRQVATSAGTAIQFLGIPLDPGPTNGLSNLRTMRITNLRVDATKLGIFGNTGAFTNSFIYMTVNFNAVNFNGNQVLSNIPVATVRGGLVVTGTSPSPIDGKTTGWWSNNNEAFTAGSPSEANFLQCTATAGSSKRSINLTEGFSTAFKVRNWRQIQDNGFFSGSDWSPRKQTTFTYNPSDVLQNVPGALYNTESGLMFPSGVSSPNFSNPPPGTSNVVTSPGGSSFTNNTGIANAGTVTQGTRLYVKFGAVPAGSNGSIPQLVPLRASSITTGFLALVNGADINGAGGAPLNTTSAPVFTSGVCTSGCTLISSLNGGLAVYEVIFSNPSAIEQARITVYVNPTVNLTASPSTPEVNPATLTGTAGFAPFYPSGVNGVNNARQMDVVNTSVFNSTDGSTTQSFPVPRFIDNQSSTVNFYDYGKCACDLLFPWVVGDATFTTSIVVANTSLDPCNGALLTTPPGTCTAGFNAAPQSGKVTFWYFGTKGISLDPTTPIASEPSQTSVSVPAGSYLAHIVSPSAAGTTAINNLTKLSGNFAGYVIAQSQFQYCHGIAAISANVPGFGTQTYIGLVLDKGTLNLPRTVQSSSDVLGH